MYVVADAAGPVECVVEVPGTKSNLHMVADEDSASERTHNQDSHNTGNGPEEVAKVLLLYVEAGLKSAITVV